MTPAKVEQPTHRPAQKWYRLKTGIETISTRTSKQHLQIIPSSERPSGVIITSVCSICGGADFPVREYQRRAIGGLAEQGESVAQTWRGGGRDAYCGGNMRASASFLPESSRAVCTAAALYVRVRAESAD